MCRCQDYPSWQMIKYDSFELVSWQGSVWEAFEWEGTDANDEPGKSIHWRKICDCEITPTPTPNTTPTPTTKPKCCGEDSIEFVVGSEIDTNVQVDIGVTINKFVHTGKICIPSPTLDFCNNLLTPVVLVSPNNENLGTIIFYGGVINDSLIYLSIEDSNFAKSNGYEDYTGICLYGRIRSGVCNLKEI